MKKFIRWLSDISGVTREIKRESYKEVGGHMRGYAHYFTGGIMVKGHKYDISNILYEYPKYCLDQGESHLYGMQFTDLREKLWKLSDANISILIEENEKFLKELYNDKRR